MDWERAVTAVAQTTVILMRKYLAVFKIIFREKMNRAFLKIKKY